MKMKKIIVFLVIMSLGGAVLAQPSAEQIERFKAQKVSYMTDKLSLTPQEAQQFWPIYNVFDQTRWKLHEQRRKLERKLRDSYEVLTDADFQRINSEMNELAKKDLDLWLKYNTEFLRVLPAKKVVLIAPAENDFRFHMIKDYKKRQAED